MFCCIGLMLHTGAKTMWTMGTRSPNSQYLRLWGCVSLPTVGYADIQIAEKCTDLKYEFSPECFPIPFLPGRLGTVWALSVVFNSTTCCMVSAVCCEISLNSSSICCRTVFRCHFCVLSETHRLTLCLRCFDAEVVFPHY